ncbi:MAG TPA: helix-turn-helix transcriptional regulator [Bacteroidia bacterium]|nr:helix-turn-helix transcriptional regulator [Bacteroidia bacterium]
MNCIKEILKAQGRSQTWLAEQIGRSYVVTTNYCNNKTQPSIQILRKIANVLDVDVRELLVETKGPNLFGIIFRFCAVNASHYRQKWKGINIHPVFFFTLS